MIEFDLKEYIEFTRTTKAYDPDHAFEYLCPALAEETGELLGKIAKFNRKAYNLELLEKENKISFKSFIDQEGALFEQLKKDVEKEAGDILWQLTRLLDELNLSISDAFATNVAKLSDRNLRGVIVGEGDDR